MKLKGNASVHLIQTESNGTARNVYQALPDGHWELNGVVLETRCVNNQVAGTIVRDLNNVDADGNQAIVCKLKDMYGYNCVSDRNPITYMERHESNGVVTHYNESIMFADEHHAVPMVRVVQTVMKDGMRVEDYCYSFYTTLPELVGDEVSKITEKGELYED